MGFHVFMLILMKINFKILKWKICLKWRFCLDLKTWTKIATKYFLGKSKETLAWRQWRLIDLVYDHKWFIYDKLIAIYELILFYSTENGRPDQFRQIPIGDGIEHEFLKERQTYDDHENDEYEYQINETDPLTTSIICTSSSQSVSQWSYRKQHQTIENIHSYIFNSIIL